jgi:regulator of replication initiation timing
VEGKMMESYETSIEELRRLLRDSMFENYKLYKENQILKEQIKNLLFLEEQEMNAKFKKEWTFVPPPKEEK